MPVRATQPEILPPGSANRSAKPAADTIHQRMGGGGGAFRDENLDLLSRVLDTWFRVPGTNIRFGVDGIVGFVPALAISSVAWRAASLWLQPTSVASR